MGGKASGKAAAGRRAPSQERGRRRVARLLDAAEEVFAEKGYEAATNTEIAERAGASIGSLYQFFPNKEAVLDALVARSVEELKELYDLELSPEASRLPLAELVGRAVGALARFHTEHPAFRPLLYGSGTTTAERLSAQAGALRREAVGRLDALFAARAPGLEAGRRRLHAEIANDAVAALLPLALGGEAERRERVVAEIEALLLAYLGPILGLGDGPEPADAPPDAADAGR